MAFSVRTVLRRESSGLIALGIAFTLLDFLTDTLFEREPIGRWVVTDRGWVIFLAVILLIGLILQFLKKMRWLSVAGR
jgi:hypothetical protein